MIHRILFIITVLLLVSAASLGIRGALHPSVTYLIVPGATQIEVLQPSVSEQVIMYHLPGPAYAWRATAEHDLATHGWARPIWWRTDTPATNTYHHVSSFWFGSIWDDARGRLCLGGLDLQSNSASQDLAGGGQ
jgi:hypothetical protein